MESTFFRANNKNMKIKTNFSHDRNYRIESKYNGLLEICDGHHHPIFIGEIAVIRNGLNVIIHDSPSYVPEEEEK